jgi:signal transduction histidine kinase
LSPYVDVTERLVRAMTSTESHAAVEHLAEAQAALRRVATLVARESSPDAVFAAVTDEAARVLGTGAVGMLRFEPDETAILVAQSNTPWDPLPLGTCFPLDGENVVTRIFRTGEAARVDDWTNATGAVAAMADVLGARSCVGTPIVVEGRTWGTLLAVTNESDPLSPDTESRIAEFTELVATAIANTEARSQLSRLAQEQAALRRVATLVAKESPLSDVLAGVARELALVVGDVEWALARDDGDGMATPVAVSDNCPTPAGTRVPIDAGSAFGQAITEGRTARIDYFGLTGDFPRIAQTRGIRAVVSYPIFVRGRTWGALSVGRRNADPLPPATEALLERFSDLVATAIANAEARAQVERLADEQAALRRVATLVAQGLPAADVFSAVSGEVARLFGTKMAAVGKFEAEQPAVVVVGAAEETQMRVPIGTRLDLDDALVVTQVYRTGRSVRADLTSETVPAADVPHLINGASTAASPIIVDGRLWGVIAVTSETEPLPFDTQERLEKFTELVATAIANTEARSELTASRARIVAASDDARRRIERDLHDGAQQRLVSLGLELRIAAEGVPAELPALDAQLGSVADEIDGVIDDLREMSRGIHPAVLSDGGLGPAIQMLARRATVPVELDLGPTTRFSAQVEVAAYYVVSEALTNTAKHANASRARVRVEERDGRVCVSIDDDGDGGAEVAGGSGLSGLRDRVEALGGSLSLNSPPGQGTMVGVELPIIGGDGPPLT